MPKQTENSVSGVPDSSEYEQTSASGEAVEALLAAFRGEDREARSDSFSALSHLYRPLLESLTARYFAIGSSEGFFADAHTAREELMQEARIGLCRAAETYGDGHHTTFGLYAKVCIRNRMVSYLRREHGMLSVSELSVDTLDDCCIGREDCGDPGETVVSNEAFHTLYRSFHASMTDYERSVFHLYIAGASYKAIAKRLGVTEKSVDNAVCRVRRKLREAMR